MAVQEAREIFEDINQTMVQLVDIKIITLRNDVLKNIVSIRIRPEFSTMIFSKQVHTEHSSILFAFMLSTQLEPVVTVVAVTPTAGRVQNLRVNQFSLLLDALQAFKDKFKLQNEKYAYTESRERLTKSWHSKHWHLRIRISTDMLIHMQPASQVLIPTRVAINDLIKCLEPIEFNFCHQEMFDWKHIQSKLEKDLI